MSAAGGGKRPGAGQPEDRRARVGRVLAFVLVANVAVIAAEVLVGLRAGSMSVLGDAAHSGVDALNNLVGLLAVRVAAAPPDEEHPYGHGKFETLGALAVVSFLSVTCFELVKGGVERLIVGGAPPELEPLTFYVLVGAVVVNAGVAWLEYRYGDRLDSELLTADARHTATDVLVTLAVLVGLGLVALGWRDGDAWLALLVAGLIAYTGYQILRETVPVLVDRRALAADRIRRFVEETPGVLEAREIRSRGRPGEAFAELTVRVDPGKNVREAHRIADSVERHLKDEGGFRDVVVHVEPERGEAGRGPGPGGYARGAAEGSGEESPAEGSPPEGGRR